MNQEELNTIIENHKHFIAKDCKGWHKMKANLAGCDLRYIDLAGANLEGANLFGADITMANLGGANLSIAKY